MAVDNKDQPHLRRRGQRQGPCGFFISDDGGANWRQSNRGLDERDVLSLNQSDEGVIFAAPITAFSI